uniref:Peptidoglycan binding-like domain-containing protein n=2 Tax=Clytia hemisphaerica TaxID=252671 RepID=A0A7M5V8T5_9CNID
MKPITGEDDWSLAMPFKESLKLTDPPMQGREVMILQNLLKRAPGIELVATGVFDENTEKALYMYQEQKGIQPANGILNPETAISVLEHLMSDGYKDDGSIQEGMKFKLYIPVYRNRSIETQATLFDGQGNVISKFLARTRGSTGDKGQIVNQLTTNGNTPTGLVTMDLNTPEPKSLVKSFGPYPVLRFVKGLKGNAAMGIDNQTETFLSNYRSGILVHTGIWDDWTPELPMPNSNGCVHVHPSVQREIVDRLFMLGVIANENPFGKLPYPYRIQGIVSVEQID